MSKVLSIFVLSIFFFQIGCGGSLTDIAEKALYPLESVNKTPVPDTPYKGFDQTFLKVESPSIDGKNVDQLRIHVWFHTHSNPKAPLLVFQHGNGANLGGMAKGNLLEVFKGLGAHVVIWDYPGYGKSKGKPNQENMANSGLAVLKWSLQQFGKKKAVVWGRSLGAAVAAQMMSRRQDLASRLILTHGWDSFMNLAMSFSDLAKKLPKEWIQAHEYNSHEMAKKITIPVLFHHGTEDKVIPYKMGQKLFSGFPNSSKNFFITLEGIGHNDIYGEQSFWSDIIGAIHTP